MVVTKEQIEGWDSYQGSTPIPEDFDAFWASRMAEADQIPLCYTVTPTVFSGYDTCEFLELRFRGMGGANLYAKYVRPRTNNRVPLVLQFHGYPGASRSWIEQASFVGMGCAIIAMDCPGQGGYSEDVGGFPGTTVAGHIVAGIDGDPKGLYYVRLYQDIRILCRTLRELPGIDTSRIFVNGGSQGGAQGIACAALNADLINRAAILYPFLSDYRMIWEMGADTIAYEGLRYYARWYAHDGECWPESFRKLSYIDTMNFAHLVKCPVLFGTGLSDDICPPITQCAVFNRLGGPKRRFLYPGFGHEEIQEFDDLLLTFFAQEVADLDNLGAN